MKFATQVKFGIVMLKDWTLSPTDGRNIRGVAGHIILIPVKEGFGFSPKGNETNWCIRVGTDDSGVMILGCQIRCIHYYTNGAPPTLKLDSDILITK